MVKSLPFTTRLVSSAYIIAKNMSDPLQMSFMYKINKRGPNIEPSWGDSTLNPMDLRFLTIKDNILSPTRQIAFNPF